MAKYILWIFVVLGFAVSVYLFNQGEETSLFTKILIFSILGVLAICESIEKLKQ